MAAYRVLRHTLVPLLTRRVRVTGAERLPTDGAFILAANHQSYLDPPLVWLGLTPILKRKLWFVTTEYVWRGLKKVFGQRGIDWMGILPIVQADKAKVVALALDHLRAGEPAVIFPEGTRNRTGQPVLLPGKTGVARLALGTGAPVVPIGLVAPPGLTTRQAIRNFFSRHPATLTVGAPLRFFPEANPSKERLTAVTTDIMRAIGQLCGKDYRA